MSPTRDTTASDTYRAPFAEKAGAGESYLSLVLQCERPLAPSARHRLDVDLVRIGRGSTPATRSQEDLERVLSLALPDRWMSVVHASLKRANGGWLLDDLGSKNGTLVNGVQVDRAELADCDLIELGHTFFLFRASSAADDQLGPSVDVDPRHPEIVPTLNPALAAELRSLEAIARSPMPIMLLGETGTGKEVLARVVHRLSGRSGPLQAINCAALPPHLVESELFGYRKGAFSDATEDRPGLIRSADRGTLFLDEIGELAPLAQASLLRVLQESEVLPLGGTRPVKVDLRVVSATHRDLERMIEKEHFRADLLARLSGFNLRLPPLRERREDIGLIIASLLRRLFPDRAESIHFTPAAARTLLRHSWPLNIRELEKCLGTSAVLAGSEPIDMKHLPAALRESGVSAPTPLTPEEERRADEIKALLRDHGGNITAVSQAMGKARMQLQRWIKRYRIDVREFKR